jgi:5'-3' exonuclease
MRFNKVRVLIDGGLLKYASRFTAKKRLNIQDGEVSGMVQLAKHPMAGRVIYDILATSMKYMLSGLSNYGTLDEVIICTDLGNSWRTKVEKTVIPGLEVDSSGDYKGHRRTDDPEELAAIEILNRHYKTAIEDLARYGNLKVLGRYGIEADDYMVVLSKYFAGKGDIVFVISKDADITQAVTSNESGGCTIILQKQADSMHMVVDHGIIQLAKTDSIFEVPKLTNRDLCLAVQTAEILAPQYMLLVKILNGDASDDITPVMVRNVNGRNYKLTAKQIGKIFDYFASKNACGYFRHEDLYDSVEEILTLAHSFVFGTDFHELAAAWQIFYRNKFKENRKMIVINEFELGELYTMPIEDYLACPDTGLPILQFPTSDIISKLSV